MIWTFLTNNHPYMLSWGCKPNKGNANNGNKICRENSKILERYLKEYLFPWNEGSNRIFNKNVRWVTIFWTIYGSIFLFSFWNIWHDKQCLFSLRIFRWMTGFRINLAFIEGFTSLSTYAWIWTEFLIVLCHRIKIFC